MLIKKNRNGELSYSEITPKQHYLNRREFIAAAASSVATVAGASLLGGGLFSETAFAGVKLDYKPSDLSTHGEKLTPLKDITNYNNFYEFGTDKGDPAIHAKNFKTDGWLVSIEGLVKKPQKLDIAAITKIAPLEERVYRMRCVERWSMVIPWIGIPLAAVLKAVEPLPKAKYVAFETAYDKKQMPGLSYPALDWPYKEGLRLDEAMNQLTILATGLYGESLPGQNGAPIRLVTPWKYGYKGIKSIVKIKLVDYQPPTAWSTYSEQEYGFYSNVNPNVDHPRWSQKKERRIGEFFLRDTLMFNGYGDFVASMYNGMDLVKHH
jgi:methionine sulfoxide reductase catalytic subunit